MIDHRSWTLPREIGRPQRQAQTEAAVGCCWRDFDEYAQHSSISTAQTHQLGAACVQESSMPRFRNPFEVVARNVFASMPAPST
jgi:hypothetical protein